MATNPYVNKVELADGTVVMDISSDTVTPGTLMAGATAHDRTGAAIVGTMSSQELIEINVTAAASTSVDIEDSRITADHVILNELQLVDIDLDYETSAGHLEIESSDGTSTIPAMHLILGIVA